MPPIALLILQGITAAIQAAPQVAEIVTKGKELIGSLVSGDLITKEQQDALHHRVDVVTEAAKRGEKPPAWEVEPDPEDFNTTAGEPPVAGT